MRYFVLLLLSCLASTQAVAVEADVVPVTVVVEGFKNDAGACRMLVFEGRKGFPEDPARAAVMMSEAIDGTTARFSFPLKSGMYAVSVIHDENADGTLDKTWYGKPTEGYGSSNNPKARSGPPSFDASSVTIDRHTQELNIKINYR